jgi:hypothetical protein
MGKNNTRKPPLETDDCRECEFYDPNQGEFGKCLEDNDLIQELKALNDRPCDTFEQREEQPKTRGNHIDYTKGDLVKITKPVRNPGFYASMLWNPEMDKYDGKLAEVVDKEGVGYLLGNKDGTFNRDTGGAWFFHRDWLKLYVSPHQKPLFNQQSLEPIFYRAFTVDGEIPEPVCNEAGETLLSLDEISELLDNVIVEDLEEVIFFKINNHGPDKLLDTNDIPLYRGWKVRPEE